LLDQNSKTILTAKNDTSKRLAQYFDLPLNVPEEVNQEGLNSFINMPHNLSLDGMPSFDELLTLQMQPRKRRLLGSVAFQLRCGSATESGLKKDYI